jgi:uncharacterized protein DUF6152
MKIKFSFLLTAAFAVVLFSIPVLAHHSFAAQYDRQKPVTLTGAVTKLDWINPHARFFIDVKDANGKVVSWELELGPTAGLVRRGWTRSSLKIGEPVTVSGFLAKDGSNLVNASTVTLSDGKKVFAGSSSESQ